MISTKIKKGKGMGWRQEGFKREATGIPTMMVKEYDNSVPGAEGNRFRLGHNTCSGKLN